MVYLIEKVTLWVVHGVPYREGYSMGGPSLFNIVVQSNKAQINQGPQILTKPSDLSTKSLFHLQMIV